MARASCLKRASVAGAPGQIGAQDLHREPTLEILVPDLVDLGEAARGRAAGRPGSLRPSARASAARDRRPAAPRRGERQLAGREQRQAPRTAARTVRRCPSGSGA